MASSPSQIPTPKSYNALPPKLDTTARPRMQIFQTPKTPASSASSPYAFGSGRTSLQFTCRKRPRQGSADHEVSRNQSGYFATPYSATANGWSNISAHEPLSRSVDLASPAPLVNTNYALAGGLDTPLATATSSYERVSDFSDVQFRRRWSTASSHQGENSWEGVPMSGPLARERNGQSRLQPTDGLLANSWSKLVLSLVGGVASKVFEFCRTSAFKGFYAGGGQGYGIRNTNQDDLCTSSMWEDTGGSAVFVGQQTPVPGQYPQNDQNFFAPQDDTPPRPSKKLHTESGAEWVLVDRAAGEPSRASTPRLSSRKTPTLNSFRSSIPRPVSRTGARRSLLPVSRRQSTVSHAGSPALHPNRPASFASARSPIATPDKQASPPSAEAQKYAARIRCEELEADVSMRRLNRQLKNMIREGKEALGTKVEIIDDEMVEDEFVDNYFAR